MLLIRESPKQKWHIVRYPQSESPAPLTRCGGYRVRIEEFEVNTRPSDEMDVCKQCLNRRGYDD